MKLWVQLGRSSRVAAMAAAVAVAAFDVCAAQSVTTVHGVVRDAQGGTIPHAELRLAAPLIAFEQATRSAGDGTFQFSNLAPGNYTLSVAFPGFEPYAQGVDIRPGVPLELDVVLSLSVQFTTVTVTPDQPLLDTRSAGTRHQVSSASIEQLPAVVGSRGLESVLVTFPGFAQNANGAIHPRGAHNQMTYVVDGLPISDQLTGAFANALDTGIVQTAELISGHVPAEFGSKVSGVAVVTTQSGLGIDRRVAGGIAFTAAGFDTWQGAVEAGGSHGRVGYFGSASAMRTDRFLDQVSIDNLHNAGRFGRGFARIDIQASTRDLLRVHGMGGGSWFEVANLRSQHAAGQDQRQALADGAAWGSYLRMLDTNSTLELLIGYRGIRAQLHPSAGDTPVTAAQDRRLSTLTTGVRYTRAGSRSTLRAGVDAQGFRLREAFSMALTNAGFNDPGSASFNAALLPHDLTRGGAPFFFGDQQSGGLLGAFVQSTVQSGPATFSIGARHDVYALLVRGQQLQPRVGLAYQLPHGLGVLRLSYNRTYQTPPNENLLLSSSAAAAALAPESVKQALGGTVQPIRPERQNVYEVGWQHAIGQRARIDVSAYRKDSRDQQDNNNFFDTGIIFPTTLAAIRVEGAEARLNVPKRRHVSGTLSVTTGRAVSSPPFTGGLFLGQDAVDLLSSGPFRIDHDQRFAVHGTVHAEAVRGTWVGASVRYDSGLVANPSDPEQVAADPDFADLLPYVELTSDPPRVTPRTIVDVAAGWDTRAGGRRRWSLRLQVTNLTNGTALYNFQSVFVGTRLVQPRTLAVRLKRYF